MRVFCLWVHSQRQRMPHACATFGGFHSPRKRPQAITPMAYCGSVPTAVTPLKKATGGTNSVERESITRPWHYGSDKTFILSLWGHIRQSVSSRHLNLDRNPRENKWLIYTSQTNKLANDDQ